MRLTDSRDNITIYNGSHELRRIEYFNATKNVSYGLCGNVIVQQNISTPGLPNTCASHADNETNETSETVGSCNVSISLLSEDVFISGEKQNYNFFINDSNCSKKEMKIEYWIEDLFGNIIKAKYNTTQNVSCSKNVPRDWTPDEIKSSEAYYIRALISDAACNDSNLSDNYDEKLIVVKGTEPSKESCIKINEIGLGSDGKAKFGDVIEIKINAYKGGTSKSAVDVWLENAEGKKAGEANFNLYSKYTNYSFSIPLQINPNCGSSLPNGSYLLKIEGMDSHDEDAIIINGTSASSCKVKTVEISNQCSCPACPSALSCKMENNTENKEVFEIIAITTPVFIGKEIETRLRINATKQINYTISSYVYNGNKLLSLGFDGKKWLKTWDANKKEIGINETTVVSLINRVANDTEPGNYKFRVRIRYDGKEHDVTRDISIKEQEEGAGQIIVPENTGDGSRTNTSFNETEKNGTGESKNATKTEIKTPTGRIVSEKSDNWFSSAVKGVIDFFKNLFKL